MSQTPSSARWIVALPARNEALRLPGALRALDEAAAGTPAETCALVLANGCEDATASVAEEAARGLLAVRVVVREVTLPADQANAGGARRAAVAAARDVFGERPFDRLLTTDADSRLRPDALRRGDVAFAGGASLVLAKIDCARDPWEPASPIGVAWGTPQVVWRHSVRQLVETLRTGTVPDPPLHDDYGGAGIAILPSAYDGLGGFAPVPSDEDRLLVAGADQAEMTVDRQSGMAVTVLTRRTGRAVGGMACAIARNTGLAAANAPCLVEHHASTIERLMRQPSHATAFADRVTEWEDATAATAALDAVITRYARRGAA